MIHIGVFSSCIKRIFDFLLSIFLLFFFFPIIFICFLISSLETKSFGIFRQIRIGRNGIPFYIYKIKTMSDSKQTNHITVSNDYRITFFGKLLRKFKFDELPQLYNILNGDMSFVGPRPDVPGFADKITGVERAILSVRPGITGLASLKYRNEEYILNNVKDPISYNNNVIWPDKVKINYYYVLNYSFSLDIKIIICTLLRKDFFNEHV